MNTRKILYSVYILAGSAMLLGGSISGCNSSGNTIAQAENIIAETASLEVVQHEQVVKHDIIYRIDTIDISKAKLDSLNNIIDSLEQDNMIKTIKLERIKQYNVIAGRGKNIVFLRGWINRVLKED